MGFHGSLGSVDRSGLLFWQENPRRYVLNVITSPVIQTGTPDSFQTKNLECEDPEDGRRDPEVFPVLPC